MSFKDYLNNLLKEDKWIVRVTEKDGPIEGKFRDVVFTDEEKALSFKEMAEEDGTYWGIVSQKE